MTQTSSAPTGDAGTTQNSSPNFQEKSQACALKERECIRYLRAVGAVVLFFVLGCIGWAAKTHFSMSISELIPEMNIESKGTDSELPCETKAQNQDKNPTPDASKSGVRNPEIRNPEITKQTSANPRVWAYAVRTLGLLGALGITLWAIVALIRVD